MTTPPPMTITSPTISHPITTSPMATATTSHPITTAYLENLKKNIERLDKQNHIEILRILTKDQTVRINETKSGCLVNMSLLPDKVIDEIQQYLDYINKRQDSIEALETQQHEFEKILTMHAE